MRNLILFICLLASTHFLHAQSVEVQGELKVTTVNQNNAGTDVLVRNGDGTVTKRDANTIGGVPSTAIVLSEVDDNITLTNAGFSKTGIVDIPYGVQGDPTTTYGKWIGETSQVNAPTSSISPKSVWTGTEMIVYDAQYPSPRARYNPLTESWITLSAINAPSNRFNSTVIWTGTEMIVWGGQDNGYTNTGAKYNPATDTWTTISTTNAPSGRSGHIAIWTGSEMIIWGGQIANGNNYTDTGARYDPATDSWTAISTTNAPSARLGHTSVWTGTEMIIWRGYDFSGYTNTGARYNPITDIWTTMATTNAPNADFWYGNAVWTGSLMILWVSTFNAAGGGVYDPSLDTWTTMPLINAPSPRTNFTGIWTGTELIVFGGASNSGVSLRSGSKYNPDTNKWLPMSSTNSIAQNYHTAVWTGTHMITWGGQDVNFNIINYGKIYDPSIPGYAPVTTTQYYLYKKN